MNGRSVIALVCGALAGASSLFLACSTYGEEDATPPAADASATPDAAGDVETTEAATDASTDAGPVPCPDGGFCDSFERTTPQGIVWDALEQVAGCTSTIDGTQAFDGKSSLKATLPFASDDACQSFLERSFDGSPKKIRMSFAARTETVITREIHIAAFDAVAGEHRALYFLIVPSGLQVAEQQFGGTMPSYRSFPIGALEPGSWHRLVLEYDLESKAVIAYLDGEPRLSDKTNLSFTGASSFTIQLGNTYSRQGDASELFIDDFRFEQTL